MFLVLEFYGSPYCWCCQVSPWTFSQNIKCLKCTLLVGIFIFFFSNCINRLGAQFLFPKVRLWHLKSILCNKMPLRKALAFRTYHQSAFYSLLLCPMLCICYAHQLKLFSIVATSILKIVMVSGVKVKGSFIRGNKSFNTDLMAVMPLPLKIQKLSTHLTTWNLILIKWKGRPAPSTHTPTLNTILCKTEVVLA